MKTQKAVAKILYNGLDITKDISGSLISISYTDNVDAKADDISITLDDTALLWANEWYPEKGAELRIIIGIGGTEVNLGAFEIDEITISGPPSQIEIKGISAGAGKPLRTLSSYAHEDKTLKEIAQTIAEKNALQVEGNIAPIRIKRATQNRETDLSFLNRIAREYGYFFSIRDSVLVFTSIYDIDARNISASIDISKIASYSFNDRLIGTYKKAEASYRNADTGQTVKATDSRESNEGGQAITDKTSDDTLIVRSKAETTQQAEAKAKSALYRANVSGQTGRISVEGNPLLLAGNAIDLTGFGALSGKYRIESSSHSIQGGEGYITELEVKRIGYISEAEFKPKGERNVATSINTTNA